jgi:hypothetical protein
MCFPAASGHTSPCPLASELGSIPDEKLVQVYCKKVLPIIEAVKGSDGSSLKTW